jgi:glycerophosphoryl diester phosphodiesterase
MTALFNGSSSMTFILMLAVSVIPASARATGTTCVAHRGNSSVVLENSLSALRSAVEVGTPIVEFDVHHTQDGIAILMHDSTLRRTAKAKDGRACDTWRKIRSLSFDSIRTGCMLNNGEEIPSLREALDLLTSAGVGIFLEFKDMPNRATIRLLDEYYGDNPALLRVISFNREILRYVGANLSPRLLIGGASLLHVSATEIDADLTFDGVSVHRPSAKYIRKTQALGLEVSAWTIDDAADIRALIRAGADYVTTNRPALCLAIAASGE